jgi:hypothetical protein
MDFSNNSHQSSQPLTHHRQLDILFLKMKFFIPVVALLAGFAMASPAGNGDSLLEARIDCSKCGCSSAESCTFDVSLNSCLTRECGLTKS